MFLLLISSRRSLRVVDQLRWHRRAVSAFSLMLVCSERLQVVREVWTECIKEVLVLEMISMPPFCSAFADAAYKIRFVVA